MGVARNIIGAVIAVAIGGTVYTVNQSAVVDNFSKDTGMTQQESKQYVEQAKNDLESWDKIGDTFIKDGQDALDGATKVDCANYTYTWISPTSTCEDGKAKLDEIGNDEIALGNAYKKLSLDSSSKSDIPSVIQLIDKVNSDYGSDLVSNLLDAKTIDEMKKTNSYNKATLQAVLQGN